MPTQCTVVDWRRDRIVTRQLVATLLDRRRSSLLVRHYSIGGTAGRCDTVRSTEAARCWWRRNTARLGEAACRFGGHATLVAILSVDRSRHSRSGGHSLIGDAIGASDYQLATRSARHSTARSSAAHARRLRRRNGRPLPSLARDADRSCEGADTERSVAPLLDRRRPVVTGGTRGGVRRRWRRVALLSLDAY